MSELRTAIVRLERAIARTERNQKLRRIGWAMIFVGLTVQVICLALPALFGGL